MTAPAQVRQVSVEAASPSASSRRQWVAPWRNPWPRPMFIGSLTWLFVVWILLPVLIAIAFSFNNGRSLGVWSGFTFDWYCCGGPDSVADGGSVVEDPQYLKALWNTLKLSLFTTLVSVPVGTALALGSMRWRSRSAKVATAVSVIPIVTPVLVLGSAMYVVFLTAFSAMGFGMPAMVLGLSTFSIAYVVLMVRARLSSIGSAYEMAAQDLGASPIQALRTVLLPMLMPAIVASGAIVFSVALDDFVISNYLFGDSDNVTVPLVLYSVTRVAPTPVFNALAAILMVATFLSLALTYVLLRLSRRGRQGSALDDIAGW